MEIIQANSDRFIFDGMGSLKRLLYNRYKTIGEAELEKIKISENAKKILRYISRENRARKIPTRRDVINDLDDVNLCTVEDNLKILRRKTLAIGFRIVDLVNHYGLDTFYPSGNRFVLPESLTWVEPYLSEIEGCRGSGTSFLKKLELGRAGSCRRYSNHYVALLEYGGRPCYEPLGLLAVR